MYIDDGKINIPKIIDNKNYCECGKLIYKTSKMCNKCKGKHLSKNMPNLDVLLKEVSDNSYESIGRKYKVTGNCIKKWIKKQGGTPPKKQNVFVS